MRGARAREGISLPRFLLRPKQLIALLENTVNRLRGTGVQAEAATFEAARGVEFVGWGREPGAGRTDGNADPIVGTTVGMAHEVIAGDHHGFDSFEETL